ncbi:hypothetical protein Tdes44962_MAKER06477 [Teratosphaeria destructans]|uniref:Rhodopsin domain-containing protein n=1 Tax=Teratosphaeria destructans TaxID=418781 RepID=A0A9W7W751_9PEZI|nr:hypothetical protein Tdes44962_MAKER06477 [Teratosphaeria destructans]
MDGEGQFKVPEGYYPPFTVITDEDHTGWIVIATALGLCMVLLSTIIRITVRSSFKQRYGLDDALIGIGFFCAVIYESVLMAATTKGLGKAAHLVDPADLESLQKCRYAVQILSVLGLGFAKGSVSAFVIRLTPVKSHRRYIHCITAVCILWSILAMLLWALKCDLRHPWVYIEGQCTGIVSLLVTLDKKHTSSDRVEKTARSMFICALDIITELLIFSSAAMLIFNLQTSWINKSVVLIAFGFRLPLIAFIALRMVTFKVGSNLTDLTLGADLYVVWTATQVNYSLISASIPLLRPFVSGLSTNYGVAAATQYSLNASRSNTNSTGRMMSTLRSLGKGSKDRSKPGSTHSGSDLELRPCRGEVKEVYDQSRLATTDAYAYHPRTPTRAHEGGECTSPVTLEHVMTPSTRECDGLEFDDRGSEESRRRILITKQVSWHIHRGDARV